METVLNSFYGTACSDFFGPMGVALMSGFVSDFKFQISSIKFRIKFLFMPTNKVS